MIIESHAHYTHMKFDGRFRFVTCENGTFAVREGGRDDILAALPENGVTGVIEPAIDLASNEKILAFCKDREGFFPAVGVHPTRVASVGPKGRKLLKKYASDPNVVAVGETGLDYHYPRKEQHRIRQFVMFQYQISLAAKRGLPLILHIRMAYPDAIRILRWNRKKLNGGVAHCFNSSAEDALALIGMGFRIGIGGALLQNNETGAALRETVRVIPLERILVETDAPYVMPDLTELPMSGKEKKKIRNTSMTLPAVIGKIAELKGLDVKTVEDAVFRNTVAVFGLDR